MIKNDCFFPSLHFVGHYKKEANYKWSNPFLIPSLFANSYGIKSGNIPFQKGSFLNFRNGIFVSVSNFCDGKILFLNIAMK